MIAVISQSQCERATEEVVAWLQYLDADHVRLNGDDLTTGAPFSFLLSESSASFGIEVDGITLDTGCVRSAWLRRWHTYRELEYLRAHEGFGASHSMHDYLQREIVATGYMLEEGLHEAQWLTRRRTLSVNKLTLLRMAAHVGLSIPETLVTNSKHKLAAFRVRCGRVICKPVAEIETFIANPLAFTPFTTEVTDELMAELPDTFFPSLAQEMVEKQYELRIFFLDGRCWAMAIFSQLDPGTVADFRHYSPTRPNRQVPYRLPAAVEKQVVELMRSAGLDTGSIDLIRAADGRYVFLEVNPVGQFGMVSEFCNYRIEKDIALHLMENDR